MSQEEHRSTARVLDILKLLAFSDKGYSLTEISKLIGAPKSSLFPIVQTLHKRNFIALDQSSSKYTIGLNSFIVGSSYIEHLDIVSYIREEMKTIVASCSETCQLGILHKNEVLYIAKVDSSQPIRLISYVGKKIPAYATALGKALLSQFTDEEVQILYPEALVPYTENTIVNIKELIHQLQAVRKTKIAYEKEEVAEHIQCIAVPLEKSNQIIAAISISIPIFRVNKEKLLEIEKQLLKSKERIEQLLDNINFDPDKFFSV
ncbi:Transcriptional regulator IclR-like protein [Alkaliphilus metalliredigens QYMF]|uniref:Transcriptional regulator IclR-like protein n=1 Tax=Alkaliphilus metalliredigens (strain QYMF) TaxID=293826 RepID=A6TKK9_ALKMQ|nr:IclR family transcriptional regulator [Alkaliphilus metalliredigens]ABR46727.1 Transcriptional regulator IclR-like protein [Alkaliphilus metalliredigens QYMF]